MRLAASARWSILLAGLGAAAALAGWLLGIERVEERTEALERANSALHESLAEHARLTATEQRLRREAERANRAKDEILAIVSHELRSPLNALRGWGFLLGSAKSPDAALIERATHAIKRNVDHQARLIEDLLDTSRIMSGKLNIERRPLNAVEIVQAALESVKQAAAAKRISLAFESDRPALMLEGDAARLTQIAVNLLSNAVKFTPEGGEVKASVETTADTVRIVLARVCAISSIAKALRRAHGFPPLRSPHSRK
jgi:signal transduction histidine kinase